MKSETLNLNLERDSNQIQISPKNEMKRKIENSISFRRKKNRFYLQSFNVSRRYCLKVVFQTFITGLKFVELNIFIYGLF